MASSKDCHLFGLDFLGNIDVGLHGLVVFVAGPFHDYLGRNAAGQGEADEGAAAGMSTHQIVLGFCSLFPLATDVCFAGAFRVREGLFAKLATNLYLCFDFVRL